MAATRRTTTKPSSPNDDNNGTSARRGKGDPLVQALLGHLPAPGAVWPPTERQHWLGLLGEALKVIYKDAEPPKPPGQPAHGRPVDTAGNISAPKSS